MPCGPPPGGEPEFLDELGWAPAAFFARLTDQPCQLLWVLRHLWPPSQSSEDYTGLHHARELAYELVRGQVSFMLQPGDYLIVN